MTRIFADHALTLHEFGLAILPTMGKIPLIGGFSHWRRRPSAQTIVKWQRKFPDANVAYHAGHSRLIVVDVDDADAVDDCLRIFGETPGRVKTRRGVHALYRASNVSLPDAINLRAHGINADLKYGFRGQSIVIAPPSQHPDGGIYSWLGCDPAVLTKLPTFDVSRVDQFSSPSKSEPRLSGFDRMRDGSRKQWINDRLCAHVASCDDFDSVLDVARTLNEQFPEMGKEPLQDDIVIKRAQKVWADFRAGRIEQWHPLSGVIKFYSDEIDRLERLSPLRAPDAMRLLCQLRREHFARCARGETFCLTPKAMAKHDVIRGWTRERYEKSRDLLLKAGLIECVSEMTSTNGMRIGAQYRFPPSGGRAV